MGLMGEYIKKNMGSNELAEELLRLIKKYNEFRNTYLLVYAGAIEKRIPDVPLGMTDYYVLFDLLRNINKKKLDFYIETPGGSGEVAEEIVRFLRSKFEDISFIVSGEAKSAGTILVLSGDEILMTKSGSLGPIDAQVRIGRSVISAYDYKEWIEKIRKEAESVKKLNPLDATMVAQISPGELNLVLHLLNFAEDLVVKWLPKYKFKNWKITETRKTPVTKKIKEKRAREIANELMNHAKWRTHGRSIKIDDLEKIGLKINRIDDDPKLSDMVYRIQTVIRLLFDKTTIYKIIATEDEKLFKSGMKAQVPLKIPFNIPKKKHDVILIEIICEKCKKKHAIYLKFNPDPKIDEKYKKQGFIPYPKDNKLKCDCDFEMDLSGIKNDVETKNGRKAII